MSKLFNKIQSIIAILEVLGALLSVFIFIFNKIRMLKNINNKQRTNINTDEKK